MHEHDDTGDKLEHAYFCYLADKFEREPELLTIPLQTISRWRQRGTWGLDHLSRWEISDSSGPTIPRRSSRTDHAAPGRRRGDALFQRV